MFAEKAAGEEEGSEVGMTETDKLLVRIGTARDAISRKTEQTSLDYMIDGVLMNCSVMLKERAEEIERLKTPTAGDNHIPLRW